MYYIVLLTDALPCLDIVLYKSVHFIWIWTGNTALQDFYLGCHHPICDVCALPMCMLTSWMTGILTPETTKCQPLEKLTMLPNDLL